MKVFQNEQNRTKQKWLIWWSFTFTDIFLFFFCAKKSPKSFHLDCQPLLLSFHSALSLSAASLTLCIHLTPPSLSPSLFPTLSLSLSLSLFSSDRISLLFFLFWLEIHQNSGSDSNRDKLLDKFGIIFDFDPSQTGIDIINHLMYGGVLVVSTFNSWARGPVFESCYLQTLFRRVCCSKFVYHQKRNEMEKNITLCCVTLGNNRPTQP